MHRALPGTLQCVDCVRSIHRQKASRLKIRLAMLSKVKRHTGHKTIRDEDGGGYEEGSRPFFEFSGTQKVASAFVETSTQILLAKRFTGGPRLPMLFFVRVSLVHLLSGSFKTWICSVSSFVTRNRDGTSLMTATQPDPNCFLCLSFRLLRLARVSSNIVSSYYQVGLPASVSNQRSDRASNFVNFGISVA